MKVERFIMENGKDEIATYQLVCQRSAIAVGKRLAEVAANTARGSSGTTASSIFTVYTSAHASLTENVRLPQRGGVVAASGSGVFQVRSMAVTPASGPCANAVVNFASVR